MGVLLVMDVKNAQEWKQRTQEKAKKFALQMKTPFTLDEIIRLVQGRSRKTIRTLPEPVSNVSKEVILVLNDLERRGIIKNQGGKMVTIPGITSI
ncbi:MAG: hypothetical protein WAZ40_01860 [Minisyncoccia bacterium]